MSTRQKILKIGAAIALLGIAGMIAAILTLQSDWARDRLRVYLEQTISKASGGRMEIGELRYELLSLRGELRNVVFHGKESAAEPPLFQARRIAVDATILSLLGRKFQVDSVEVETPALRIALYEDGSTNLPAPETPATGPPVTHTLIDLGVRRFAISDGLVDLAEQTIPLHVRGEDLDISLAFLPTLERYDGEISASRLSFDTDSLQPIPFAFQSSITLERDELRLSDGQLSYQNSNLGFSVTLSDFAAPAIVVPFEGSFAVADFRTPYSLPVEPTGNASASGEFRYAAGEWSLSGSTTGSGLALRTGNIRVSDIGLRSDLQLQPDAFVFSNLRVNALGGNIDGEASFRNGNQLQVTGKLDGLALDRISRASGMGELAYNSRLFGDLRTTAAVGAGGLRNIVLDANLLLRATGDDNPLSGEVHASFTERDGMLRLSDTFLEFSNSHIRADGDIRNGLNINAASRRLADFLPALALISEEPETLLPVELLPDGEVSFAGSVTGEWQNPELEGLVRARHIQYDGRSLDSISLRARASKERVAVDDLIAHKGDVEIRGELELPLENWEPNRTNPLRVSASVTAASLNTILAEAEQSELPVSGSMTAQLDVEGTLDEPVASLRARLRNAELWGEPLDEVSVEAEYADDELTLSDAHVTLDPARMVATGVYRHRPGNIRDGEGELRFRVADLSLVELQALKGKNFDANASLRAESAIQFRYRNERIEVQDIQGKFSLEQIQYAGQAAGELALNVSTSAGVTTGLLKGQLADSTIEGEASVQLNGEYPAKGRLALNRLTLDSIRGWLPASMSEANLPLSMLLVSTLTFEGSLANPEKLRAELLVDELRLARILPRARTLAQERQFELVNARPIRFIWDGTTLQVADATITGADTSLSLSGSVSPNQPRQQLNLRAKGDLDFKIFNAFEPSLEAGGSSELDLTIQGTLASPDVYGTLDLKDASIYLVGVPNGLDKVNGRIFLYRDRATIEEITAQSGGGELTLSGFVSYVSGTPNFRLSFRGQDVRVRYPPGVSTSADAALELTGSTSQSILSGTVSITRASVNPRSDLASILSASAQPVATPSASQNEFVRNMRFDVQVRTAPDVRFDSTLTQDLSGEADLRLRGNPYNPVLLGNVAVNQGEINFFGNKYYIDRGDISFINPLKLEPVLNLDLRTRVRSIDVTLTFSGPIDKLNVNYRSDPPLQLNEIIALLTVGRAPEGAPSLAEAQSEAAQSWQQVGASALVGQAVAAPIAGRLQKFFGVSRIKIDPRLTGVENNPQARLTVEQQVSRDITVTFITNLAGAQQQVVRVEWNFNPQFSMVALRDEDGLFGIDFLYRRRF